MSRAEKYEDLTATAWCDSNVASRDDVKEILHWIDEHRDQAPGPTITESRVKEKLLRRGIEFVNGWTAAMIELGATVIPDPEPTNAEKLAAQVRLTLRENAPDSCKNVQDVVAERIAADLDAAGVKAPGGE